MLWNCPIIGQLSYDSTAAYIVYVCCSTSICRSAEAFFPGPAACPGVSVWSLYVRTCLCLSVFLQEVRGLEVGERVPRTTLRCYVAVSSDVARVAGQGSMSLCLPQSSHICGTVPDMIHDLAVINQPRCCTTLLIANQSLSHVLHCCYDKFTDFSGCQGWFWPHSLSAMDHTLHANHSV